MGIRVGIDLGTTFSTVAKINEVSGKPEIIKNSFNSSITPSVLCFEKNVHIIVVFAIFFANKCYNEKVKNDIPERIHNV